MLNMLRIKELRKAKGMTQAQVADELGIHLTNYNKLENGTADLTLKRMEEISKILDCEATDLISVKPAHTRMVTITQGVAAGVWSESTLWDEDQWYEVAVPDAPELRGVKLYGAEVHGPSMNRRYPEGSALIYTSMVERPEALIIGKRYIVEVERSDGLREATVKTLWRDDNGKHWLLPESTDPRYQAPIAVDGAEGDNVRVVGRIRYSVQRED